MKLLLDENLPHELRHLLPGHDCFTVAYMRWGGIVNNDLLSLAASHGFDAMLTKDANLPYEQNLVHLQIAVVIIAAVSNDIEDIRPLLPALKDTLQSLKPRCVTHDR